MTFTDDHLRGWQAAENGLPFDPLEVADWREGYSLFKSTQASKRAWADEDLSVLVH